jgi:hypothetical protein
MNRNLTCAIFLASTILACVSKTRSRCEEDSPPADCFDAGGLGGVIEFSKVSS